MYKWLYIGMLTGISCAFSHASEQPNILFAIADDWGCHAGAYGTTPWIKTPAFDRLAREGVLFANAFTPNAKCAPSRAIILTGRYSWQLRAAANHQPFFPAEFKSFPEALIEHGYFVGATGKGWAPGIANDANDKPRQLCGQPYQSRTATPPARGISNNDYTANFKDFLDAAPKDQPWFFWFGAYEPHRGYEYGSGINKGDKNLDQVDHVPDYWPDNETVRTDMLDYAFEVEHVDRHLQMMLAELKKRGQLDNTLVVFTSDHGMPFPRVKGQAYLASNHIPLAIRWPKGITHPGRTVNDYVSFVDLAPTFLAVTGLSQQNSGMAAITGQSLLPILTSSQSGQIEPGRDYMLIGKERHDVGRPNDAGYPIRGLIRNDFLYLHNWEPDRWPAGNPETGYLNTDGSPTKTFILDAHRKNRSDPFWALNFGKRPLEELYNLKIDPDCVKNLADNPQYTRRRTEMSDWLTAKLTEQEDPRVLGHGEVFDQYPVAYPAQRNFYERYMNGEPIKAGWVNQSDFETQPPYPQPEKKYPEHWGDPPKIQTRDLRELPGGYGMGSSTLANWIQMNLDKDAAAEDKTVKTQPVIPPPSQQLPDSNSQVTISGQLRQWHKVTLNLAGPSAREQDNNPNPFTDYNLTVTFTHESGSPSYQIPGYFAADGNAANSSAVSGTCWRAHLAPDKPGRWTYVISFTKGDKVALDGGGKPQKPYDGLTGRFQVTASDKTAPDFRALGRLDYVGKHYLQFAGSKDYFLKAGPDAPETLLAYADFDNTQARKPSAPLKTWQPHIADWQPGDPTWKQDKGKGLIGALNYLAGKGLNAFSFLPYNAGGDGDNVWPFVAREDKMHYDCSKLDQWGMVFDHATARGLYLHFKLQETEIDDNRRGQNGPANVPESLDGGKLGPERKLYCRELIARFAHNLALNWNIGEENTQTTDEINAMADYIAALDPYHHPIVIHTYPDQQDKVYPPLLGDRSRLTGASLQNSWNAVHQRTLKWVTESAAANRPWVVANDEQNGADTGVPPDMGYQGYKGTRKDGAKVQSIDDIRKATLWGNLMAGGAGVEYYFGYQLPQSDLVCEDYRSRDQSWDYCRIALDFFHNNHIPFWQMTNADPLIGNEAHSNEKYCLAQPNNVYVVYLPNGDTTQLDLTNATGRFFVKWYNPRTGGPLQNGSIKTIKAGKLVSLGNPPSEPSADWIILLRKN